RCGADWCGNAGWFPLLPWLAAAVHAPTGLSLVAAAVGIAFLFHAATLVLLWTTFLERRLTFGALGALAYAAFAPGLVFHESLFPVDQRIELGRWNAYLLVQRKYGHVFEQPFAQLENALSILHHHSPFAVTKIIPVQTTFGITSVTADETVFVALLLACGVATI